LFIDYYFQHYPPSKIILAFRKPPLIAMGATKTNESNQNTQATCS